MSNLAGIGRCPRVHQLQLRRSQVGKSRVSHFDQRMLWNSGKSLHFDLELEAPFQPRIIGRYDFGREEKIVITDFSPTEVDQAISSLADGPSN